MKKLINLLIILSVCTCTYGLFSCDDDPGVDNYYTSTKEYASDFLKGRSENFSEFIKILNRATGEKGSFRLMDLLGTYGSYTVFAPTNSAIEKYLAQKGVSSVEELSKEDCDTLALNHIIEQEFFTTDYNNGTYPTANMLERYLTITCDSDTTSVKGQVRLALLINKSAYISQADDSVMNGVVHVVSSVISTQNGMLPDIIREDSTVSIFYEALRLTGLDAKLQEEFIDQKYERCKSPTFEKDSVDWTNDKLCMKTGNEHDNVAYMKHRYNKFTVFIEPDELLKKNGINNVDDLKRYAKEVYDEVYPEYKDNEDYKDRNNSLNRFVAYHILPFQQTYYQLTAVDGPNSTLANLFNRRRIDIADWYETLAPHSVMKFSFPSGPQYGLYINRRGVMNQPDIKGFKIDGAKVATPDEMPDNIAVNGVYYYVKNIVTYSKEVQDNVISGERMRIDATTFSPDFLTSGARGHYTTSTIENGKYGIQAQGAKAANNHNTCVGFKAGFAKNLIFSDNLTHVHVRNRTLSFWSYEGDELTILGKFDIAIKMPPVPEGEWEVRMFSCIGFDNRGIVQFYFGRGEEKDGKLVGDMKPCGIPIDMRPDGTDPRIGYKSDSDLGDEDAIASFDKQFRNRGWMKGMSSYSAAMDDAGSTSQATNRNNEHALRKIITVFHSDGKSDYWLRCQQKLESAEGTMAFDCLELVPSSVYNNEYYAEDRL